LTLVQAALDEVSTDLERVFGRKVVVVVVVVVGETQNGTDPFQNCPSHPRTDSPMSSFGGKHSNRIIAPSKSVENLPFSGARRSSHPVI
jgi:hypothetical protein